MAIWLLAYHLYHYAKGEMQLAVENTKLAINYKQALLDNLHTQLNPHFLFNALNTIKYLSQSNPAQAERAIDLLSDLLRNSLYRGDQMLISLKEELQLVTDYLELEQMRFEERLSYQVSCGIELHSVQLPRLSIQTLVENATKHGIAKSPLGGTIHINLKASPGYLEAEVQNPGTLRNEGKGLGLKNLRQRLEISYQGRAVLSLTESNHQVCANLKIPIA
jgi:LytS/YehU family sensor histidine kinase